VINKKKKNVSISAQKINGKLKLEGKECTLINNHSEDNSITESGDQK